MQESATSPFASQEPALTQVARALAELRRGGVVLLQDKGKAAIVQGAEAAHDIGLSLLRRLAGTEPVLLLTKRRGLALGLRVEDEGPVALVLHDRSAERIVELADPSLTESRPLARAEVVARPGLAEAAIHLVKMARLLPAAILATPAPERLAALKEPGDLIAVEADAIAHYRDAGWRHLARVTSARVPLADAVESEIHAFRPGDGGPEHLAIVIGKPDLTKPVLLRLHSECFTGDLLASLRCDCGEQLRGAIAAIAKAGSGILLYLAQEGRGIGLVNKLRAYRLQDGGADTADANEQLGFDADERVYLPAAEMLRQLGVTAVRLLTNNPEKVAGLEACGVKVAERVPHAFPANDHNEAYLATKAKRFGHLF